MIWLFSKKSRIIYSQSVSSLPGSIRSVQSPPIIMNLSRKSTLRSSKKSISSSISSLVRSTSVRNAQSCHHLKAIIKRMAQTRALLKMFSVVVIVFVVCMAPAQILWLLKDFNDLSTSATMERTVFIFTYTNSVFNPWIYGGLNKTFRRDILKLFRKITLKIRLSIRSIRKNKQK